MARKTAVQPQITKPNLITGWTKVLTDAGEMDIQDCVKHRISIWNGTTESSVKVVPINIDEDVVSSEQTDLLVVSFDRHRQLFVPKCFRFTLSNNTSVRADEIKPGDVLRPWKIPNGSSITARVTEIQRGPSLTELYYISEPNAHAMVLNGIGVADVGG